MDKLAGRFVLIGAASGIAWWVLIKGTILAYTHFNLWWTA